MFGKRDVGIAFVQNRIMLRICCRTELFNDADFLRQAVKGEELEVKGGEGLFWTVAPAGGTGAVAGPTRYQCWCSAENNNNTVGDRNLLQIILQSITNYAS
ncbi:hypothetical protein DPMN_002795 [Dreissena polymorpha]|uniref:Uncharacterized protein n=1 Tax=Dreissena polymorpha TaxID=45954 RepID=A0A9D4RS33_DREPO|nr:hypothetical protein DPMN_002795 [Dreissena polymorpha]